jgi:hypothetical protein
MDDIAFLKPTGEVDPTLKEMLQVKNSVPYCPPQAALEDKGRTPVRAELLIGTTNTKNLNLHAYFACPFAIARRLSYIITAKIKPQYAKNGIMADSSKIPETKAGEYMNIWDFVISVPKPAVEVNVDCQGTKYDVIHEFSNVYDMLAWYIQAAKDHNISQEKALRADTTMFDIEVCKDCYLPNLKCSCVVAQNAEDIDDLSDSPSENEDEVDTIARELERGDYTWWFKVKLWCVTHILQYDVQEINLPCSIQQLLILILICFSFSIYTTTISLVFIGFGCLLYRYIWFILAHYYQYKFGWYWKHRLSSYLLLTDHQILRFIFYTKGQSVRNVFTTNKLKKLAYFCGTLSTIFLTYGLIKARSICKKEKKSFHNMNEHLAEMIGNDPKSNLKPDWDQFLVEKAKELDKLSATDIETIRSTYKKKYVDQGSVGSVPVPSSSEKPTFYYQDPYSITEVDISSQSKTIQGDILEKKLSRNVAKFIFRFDDAIGETKTLTNGLNIKGTLWLLNKHTFRKTECMTGTIDIIIENIEQNVSKNLHNVRFSAKDITLSKDRDLAIIDIRALPPGLSLLEYFPKNDPLKGIYTGMYTIMGKNGDKKIIPVSNLQLSKCVVFNIPAYHGVAQVPTQVGECGSPLMIYAGKAKVIGGIHTSGANNGNFFAQIVTQKLLEPLLNSYVPQVDCNEIIPISAKNYPRSLVPVHDRCALRWVPRGTATMYGSFTGFRPKHTSKVKKTFIRDEVVKDGYVDNCGPPDMSWRPWNKAILDMTNPNHVFENHVIDECVDAFFADIIRLLPAGELSKVEVYTQDVALNGVEGVTFVDRINIRTSAGNPYKKSKLNFIELDENNKITSLDESIQERIDLIEETYAKGKRFHPQFCGHMKDEALPWSKILMFKTRLFTGGPFPWCVVVRRFLLSHIRLIQNNPYVFEAMPGIVAQSTEWTDLYNYLITFGKDRIIAGDYGKFDKKMAAPFILGAFRILRKLAEAAGWSEEDLRVIDCISSKPGLLESIPHKRKKK